MWFVKMNEPTVIVFQPGPMIRLGGHYWETGVVPTLRAQSDSSDAAPRIAIFFDGYNQKAWEDITVPLRTDHDAGDCVFIEETDMTDNPIAFSHYSSELSPGDMVPTLRSGTNGTGHAVTTGEPTMQVRRLTPIECERLMGWPDNHTLPRADGKTNSDTTRYKMCGNGVASPVAEWIGEQLMRVVADGDR